MPIREEKKLVTKNENQIDNCISLVNSWYKDFNWLADVDRVSVQVLATCSHGLGTTLRSTQLTLDGEWIREETKKEWLF